MIPSKENIDRLMAAATAEERMDCLLAWNGNGTAMQEYKNSPGSKTLADMNAAREHLQVVADRLAGRYFPDEAEKVLEAGDRFVNRKQALNWLQSQGYKVGQDKFYKDCKAGFPRVHRDKSVSKFEAMQYGQQLDMAIRGGDGASGYDSSNDEARKTKADADMAEMKSERMRREEDKYWLHAEEAWATMAALIGTLRDSIRHHLHEGSREVVHLAGGDQVRSQEVFEGVDQLVSRAFNEVAGNGINVVFERKIS